VASRPVCPEIERRVHPRPNFTMFGGEQTPLLDSKANADVRTFQAGENQLQAGAGSLWDTLGPITSAVLTLPVLLAH